MSEDKPDLAAVLDHYGVDYDPSKTSQKCLCPVHEDHIKSCSINLDEQWFVCHACGAKGDSWNLIMAKEECDYPTAKRHAEGFALARGTNVSGATIARDDGILGHTRPGRSHSSNSRFRPSFDRA